MHRLQLTLEYPLLTFPCMHNSSLLFSKNKSVIVVDIFRGLFFLSSQVDCTLMHKEDSRDSYRRCSEKYLKRIESWGWKREREKKVQKWGWMVGCWATNTSRGNCWKAIIFSADFMLILIFKMKSCKNFLPSSLISATNFDDDGEMLLSYIDIQWCESFFLLQFVSCGGWVDFSGSLFLWRCSKNFSSVKSNEDQENLEGLAEKIMIKIFCVGWKKNLNLVIYTQK